MTVVELTEAQQEFIEDVTDGLSQKQKTLPCKYFYDEAGSILFEEICKLDEYYITRTELALLQTIKNELAQLIGSDAAIIEPGAGAGIKIQTLLAALDAPHTYMPIDISADFLFYSAEKIADKFPRVNILPVQGDFTDSTEWTGDINDTNRIVFFPGSTIGNFTPGQAKEFLINQAHLVGKQGALIIGVDLVKSARRLESAYNDSQGVTGKFNKNLLRRINDELEGDFDLDSFDHRAVFNTEQSRIEMHLISRKEQSVNIGEQNFEFKKNENIHTENSYKYSVESFTQLAESAGLKSHKCWLDDQKLFSIHYLVAAN